MRAMRARAGRPGFGVEGGVVGNGGVMRWRRESVSGIWTVWIRVCQVRRGEAKVSGRREWCVTVVYAREAVRYIEHPVLLPETCSS